jgi:DNA-binding NtrC family response regulator
MIIGLKAWRGGQPGVTIEYLASATLYNRATAYDHLVTDVVMEPMNGIQLCIAMQAVCPECQVLLMSGSNRTADLLAEAVGQGHTFDIFAKPVHPTTNLDRLRNGTDTGLLPN